MLGGLLIAALNALSFFVRTGGWGTLLGQVIQADEAIGFPWLLWRDGFNYGGLFVELTGLFLNSLVGALVGTIFGLVAVTQTKWLNHMVEDIELRYTIQNDRRLQFSIRGLFVAMAISGVFITFARHIAPQPEVLFFIYLCGPTLLVILAMLPRRISWQQRVTLLTPIAITLIGVAIFVGIQMKMEFERVLMGIFVCWVPQSVFTAMLLTTGTLTMYYRRSDDSPRGSR